MNSEVSQTKSPLTPVIYSRDEHNISRQNIDPDALKIMYRLIRNGYKAFLVGGGVRDLLLDKKPKDFDISTDATPRRIKSLFRNSRIIGRRFKLVHVYFRGNKNIEVSTFRDISSVPEPESGDDEGALPPLKNDNIYGDESTDALRRDLTINGLFYDLANFSVIDYVGGMQDLRSGVIRIIGNPDERFAEDPVRLLRAIRHAARNGFAIEAQCWDSIINNRDLILKSSAVRVFEELKKDLVGGHLLSIISLLSQAGLLELLLPEISARGAAFLTPGSEFMDCIRRVDELVREEEAVSATVVLAVIVLLAGGFSLRGGEDQGGSEEQAVLPSDEELAQMVRESFISLAVPRKEKERIERLLSDVFWLLESDLAGIKTAGLVKKQHFKDLLPVFRILDGGEKMQAVMDFLREADSNKQVSDGSGRERRRRRGGRHSGPRRDRRPLIR